MERERQIELQQYELFEKEERADIRKIIEVAEAQIQKLWERVEDGVIDEDTYDDEVAAIIKKRNELIINL
jgi:hypothetical protein